jgi:hypothetical protein
MGRTAIAAAAALVGLTGLSGAAIVPATGAGGGAHTRHLVLHETGSHQLNENAFVGTDKARSARTGDVVGFDSFTGRFFPAKHRVVIQVALALKGGIIVGRVSFGSEQRRFEGPILKGTGKYRGVDGSITGRFRAHDRTTVTLHYTL